MSLINYEDPEFIKNPFPTYERLRNEHPIFFWDEGFCWMFMKHEDVKPLLKDPRLTTDFRKFEFYDPSQQTIFEKTMENGVFGAGPEDHRRLRALAAPSLAPRIIETATPMIEKIIAETFKEIEGKQVVNFAKEISFDVPREVVSQLVGIPTKDDQVFKDMATAVIDCADFTMSYEERKKICGTHSPRLATVGRDHRAATQSTTKGRFSRNTDHHPGRR